MAIAPPTHGHARQRAHAQPRDSACERGYDHKWRTARLAYLKRNPLCVACLADGKYYEAQVVDHIVPFRDDPALKWDRENWQALCKRHHDIKTALHDGAFGRVARQRTGGG